MTYETILTARDGDVLTITLNRPDRLNAATPEMFEEIGHAVDHLDGARAVLIHGEGRGFCSGADLAARGERPLTGGEGAYAALTGSFNPTMLKLSRLPVPIVTAVNGPAAGIGCSLALAADFCIAGESAYFLQAFVNIGLVPDGGASWMLARLIGKARATEMMLLGERIHGPKAAEWGLVHKSVADDAVLGEARTLAARLAAGPTMAIGLMRQGLAEALDGDYAAALQREAENQRQAGNSADAIEGAASFLMKRKAVFRGA
ncbi:enoyl-CoA hydratase-related protein [Sphingomonas sp. SUN039]|uniref:enoyl-CoA hydratase-related protein n=1 Tax=Sphingomonas sp. SUN039 TaxID=2937787 RepID=UPI00216427B1|nr:enoyl-CoA hydratase-related protein [Sphingomonas sp. SUN039]UVO52808.1 enoyl-CoA hydratase-related protein [Sphingomonas sp. SUN039]